MSGWLSTVSCRIMPSLCFLSSSYFILFYFFRGINLCLWIFQWFLNFGNFSTVLMYRIIILLLIISLRNDFFSSPWCLMNIVA